MTVFFDKKNQDSPSGWRICVRNLFGSTERQNEFSRGSENDLAVAAFSSPGALTQLSNKLRAIPKNA
jgi:hypothetical protein